MSLQYQIIEKSAKESLKFNTENRAYYVLKATDEDRKIVNELLQKYSNLVDICLKKIKSDMNIE